MKKNKVLFILKRKSGYDEIKDSNIGMSTGLYNSAIFVSDMLNQLGIDSKVSVVVDNNSIDREVSTYKPTHVFIEALWVVPSKFHVLCNLHPKVKWIVRLHSEVPFLANEGNAMDWLGDYIHFENVSICLNSPKTTEDIRNYVRNIVNWKEREIKNKVFYLPNYYPQFYLPKKYNNNKDEINIACFGAIRPMKNHLIQAMAAVEFANIIGKKLKFHINSGRIEQRGDSVYKNLKSYFLQISDSGHQLIKHDWCPREEFLKICSKMDIGMQISLSETFNIVTADLVSQGVPILTSKEVPWVNKIFTANPTSTKSIIKKLFLTHLFPKFNFKSNQYLLDSYSNKSKKMWVSYLKKY